MKKNLTQKLQKSFFSRILLAFAVVIVVVLSFGVVREYFKRRELDKEVAGLEQELEKLKLKKKGFLDSINAYQGAFFLEQEARTKFNLKKDGEKVAVIPVSEVNNKPASANTASGADSGEYRSLAKANLLAWRDYFFGDNNSR